MTDNACFQATEGGGEENATYTNNILHTVPLEVRCRAL